MPDEPPLLPAVPDGGQLAGVVLDGEVVPPRARLIPAPVRLAAARPHARRLGRHAGYVAAGMVVVFRRYRQRRTRHETAMRALQAQGNHEAMLAWRQQAEAERQARHARRKAAAEVVVLLLRNVHWIIGGGVALMAGAGLLDAVGMRSPYGFAVPWMQAARLYATVSADVGIAVTVAGYAVPSGIVLALWHLGRTGGGLAPGWLATSADPDADVSIDEVTITSALGNMRIPQVRDYLKQGLPLQFLVSCRQEGRGTYAEIRLPGVPAERVIRRRPDFAAGLYRLPKEVWPSVGSEAAILKLWIADKGALEEGAGPYPLLADGACDVFKGVPFGRTLRGDPVLAPLMERNTLTGGMPGQGKSSAARVIMCGAALDPTAELWILIPDTNFDFEALKRRCSRYVMGAEDDRVETIRDWLRDLREEVQRRGQLLVDHEIPAVSRKLASAGVGLHPLFVLLEEAHVAITHPVYGKEISGLLVDVVKLGRKRGIHVIVSTQAPTKDSMPRDVTRNCSNGIAFAVGDHVANDALLGQGAYAGGHRATELIPGTDRGTALCKGFSGERSEMVQVYFIDVGQVPAVVDRALAEIARLGRGLPGGLAPLPAIESRDLLADLDQVLGGERVKLRDAAGMLRNLAPSWGRYKAMTAVQLRADLEAEGVKTVNVSGTFHLDPPELRRVKAEREASE